MNKDAIQTNNVLILYYCGKQAYVPMHELCLAEELDKIGFYTQIIPILVDDDLHETSDKVKKVDPYFIISWMQRPYVTAQHYDRFSKLSQMIDAPHYFGGIFASMLRSKIIDDIQNIKGVFVGYNFMSIAKIMSEESLPSGVIQTIGAVNLADYILDFSLISNIDKLKGKKIYGYMTSYSCPNNCHFCFNNILKRHGMNYSSRTFSQARDDITRLQKLLGTNEIAIKDLNFFCSEYAADLLSFMKDNNIKLAGNLDITLSDINENILEKISYSGIKNLFFGLETFNEEILKSKFNKNEPIQKLPEILNWLDEKDIQINGIIMYGFPWQTKKSLKNDIHTAIEYMNISKNINIRFSPYMPLPNTLLQERFFPGFTDGLNTYEIIKLFDTSKYNKRYKNNEINNKKLVDVDLYLLSLVSRNMLILRSVANRKKGLYKLFSYYCMMIYIDQMKRIKFNIFTRILNKIVYAYERIASRRSFK